MKEKIGELSLSSSPYGEECAQVGEPGYATASRNELKQYRRMLEAQLKDESDGIDLAEHIELRAKRNAHDFGDYGDVVAVYYSELGLQLALHLENNQPELWDDEAKAALGLAYTVGIWECDVCESVCMETPTGKRAILLKGVVQEEVTGIATTIHDVDNESIFDDELKTISWHGSRYDSKNVCAVCLKKEYAECEECGEYAHKDDVYVYNDDSGTEFKNTCGEDCYYKLEAQEGEDNWKSFGESDSERMLQQLADDEDTPIAELKKKHDEVWDMLCSYYQCSRGHNGSWGAPYKVEDIRSVLGKDEYELALSIAPPKCPECEHSMKSLVIMQENGLDYSPAVSDDDSWYKLRDDHEEGCRWYETRGFRIVTEECA